MFPVVNCETIVVENRLNNNPTITQKIVDHGADEKTVHFHTGIYAQENSMADFSNKVIYQIYPKSFKDSNGDGIGDLRGVAEKLDYLKDLGVDYLWLTPFFVSPQRDNGYDVADYRNIDPMFGTMEDLDNLIAEGEKRNIGLMFDMVFNHTSTSHEWFRRALAGEKNIRIGSYRTAGWKKHDEKGANVNEKMYCISRR